MQLSKLMSPALCVGGILVVAGVFSACNSAPTDVLTGADSFSNERVINPAAQDLVSRDEITLVDLGTLARISDSIMKSDPQVSDESLRSLILDELRSLKQEEATVPDTAAVPSVPGYSNLTWAEFRLLMANLRLIEPTKKATDDALTEAQRQWPNILQTDTKADAFRHAYWNVLLCKRISFDWANKFTTAHESESTDIDAMKMDLHNNSIGRATYNRNSSKTESWSSSTLKNYRYVFYKRGFKGSFDGTALVYIKQ